MKHQFLLNEDLTLSPVGELTFTQNSVGTKFLVVKPDGWVPAEGETLSVAFETMGENAEHLNLKLDPIQMGKAVFENIYYCVMPSEVMLLNGKWYVSVYKLFNYNEETGTADAQEVGEMFGFDVVRTIRDDSGNAITKYDLANIARLQKDIEGGVYATRGLLPWKSEFMYHIGEIAFYTPIAGYEFGAFVRSLTDENKAEPYDGDGILNAESWEEVINFNFIREDFWNTLKGLAGSAESSSQAAAEAAGEAKAAAEAAKNSAGMIAELKERVVHYVRELPNVSDATEGEAYAVLGDSLGNMFDIYLAQDGEWVYLGGERFLTDGEREYTVTLKGGEAWVDGRQSVTLPEFREGWIISTVAPADESVSAYLLNDVRIEGAEGGSVSFTCKVIPEEDVGVRFTVRIEYEVPTLSEYYTAPQTDELLEELRQELREEIEARVQEIVAEAPEALDTLKEIADWIGKDEKGTADLLKRVSAAEAAISEIEAMSPEEVGDLFIEKN